MIPEFVAEGLTSPTTSLALVALTATATALNVEIGHLRRVYNLAATNPSTTVHRDTTTTATAAPQDCIVAVVPPKLPWQLRFGHWVGLFSTGLLSAVSFVAPKVCFCWRSYWWQLKWDPRPESFAGSTSSWHHRRPCIVGPCGEARPWNEKARLWFTQCNRLKTCC